VKAQISLTVEAGKRLIARAVTSMPVIQRALTRGQIIIKGGTTTSLISEKLCGIPLKISGRIDRQGTGSCAERCSSPHNIILREGRPIELNNDLWQDKGLVFSCGDVCIIGANLVDCHGRAAMLAGSPLGGGLHFFTALPAEGVEMIVVAGLEKFAPCSIDDAITAAGRSVPDLSMGMGVGLIPLPGRVISEIEACSILGASKVQVIARGGIQGAEGGCTLLADFNDEVVGKKFFNEVLGLSSIQKSAGDPDSLKSCLLSNKCGPSGVGHRACWYRTHRRN
jgi:hypothetical protein